MNWKPKIAISTACFDGYPLRSALERLATVRDTSIELAYIAGYVEDFSEDLFSTGNAKTIRKLLDDTGSSCSAVSAHTDLASEGGLDRGVRRIEFAGAIGASRVVSNAAVIAHRDSFFRNLEKLVREAECVGVCLLLENPGDGKTNVVDNGATADELISRFSGSALGINYDFGNVVSHFRERVRPEEDWLPVRSSVSYFHIKDVDVVDDDEITERTWFYPEIGTGMIDYEAILPMIAADRAVGAIGVELPLRLRRSTANPAGRTSRPLPEDEILAIAQRSVSFIRQHLDSAD